MKNYDHENFDARHGRLESGAAIKSRKGLTGVERGRGICYQWKEKGQCSNGNPCSFRHESNNHAQKPEHTAATPSGPTVSRGRSVSKKRSIKGKSIPGIILRQPCRYYLKCTCNFLNELGCEAGDKCLFPHYEVDEQSNKQPKKERPFSKKKRKRRQKCSGYCDNFISVGLCLARHGCIGFSKRKTAPEKPDAKSLGIDSKNTIRSVNATSSEYPGKERTIAWKNTSQ